jgi:hypothetical protein
MTAIESVDEWSKTASRIRSAIGGLTQDELDLTGGSQGWSIRETVHHLVEANLVASNMIIAALATDGYDYDWTWVNPSKSWLLRMGYDKADVNLAIKALLGVCDYLASLITADPEGLSRTVKVNDAAGAPRYVLTVEKILRQEIEHADEHLADVQTIRNQHLR